jgi:hypothetical protein
MMSLINRKVVGKRIYSETELRSFEETMGVSLPAVYRRYLNKVGAGERFGSKVSLLEDWCQPYFSEELPTDFLARPFPHRKAWNDLSLLNPALGWKSAYFDRLLISGSMRIGNLGDEGYYVLVVSGPERGYLWCDERVSANRGIYPLESRRGKRITIDRYLSRWPFLRKP